VIPRLASVTAAVRTSLGSCASEWILYDRFCPVGFWAEYHDGPLPSEIRRFATVEAMDEALLSGEI
jgi:hypothetical protein